MFECCENRGRRIAETDGEASRDQRVRGLKAARKRKRYSVGPSIILDGKRLPIGARRARDELQRLSTFANGQKAQIARPCSLNETLSMGGIGVDDGNAVGTDQ